MFCGEWPETPGARGLRPGVESARRAIAAGGVERVEQGVAGEAQHFAPGLGCRMPGTGRQMDARK